VTGSEAVHEKIYTLGTDPRVTGSEAVHEKIYTLLGIASKEVRETAYWLTVVQRAAWKATGLDYLLNEAVQLAAILSASARTARANARKDAP
jgi:hypothetical protein